MRIGPPASALSAHYEPASLSNAHAQLCLREYPCMADEGSAPDPPLRREFSPSALAGEPPWLAMLGLTLADAHDGLLQCGVDVIEIPRIQAAIGRWGQPL